MWRNKIDQVGKSEIRGGKMAAKTDTEVVIGNRVFTLSGYESKEYLQKVASYINNKMQEYNKIDGFRRQSLDTQSILMQLNIADDYFKAQKDIDGLQEDINSKEKEIYELKHELISMQIKLESTEKAMKAMQDEINSYEKKLLSMETETKTGKK